MQDRFVGDIGDFGKYGLLRALTGTPPPAPENEPRLSLGVVWCVPDEQTIAKTPKGHGQSLGYLFNEATRERFRDCDPDLFDCLKELVCSQQRTLRALEQTSVLGDAVFYGEDVPRNKNARKEWLNGAMKKVNGRDVVFVDPDIGLASPKMEEDAKKGKISSSKHLYFDEVRLLLEQKESRTLIAYQQYAYTQKDREMQMQQWREATQNFSGSPRVISTSQRAFIILPASDHASIIDKRLHALKYRWGKRFCKIAL